MTEMRNELNPPFEILEPSEWVGPIVFNSPHSGCVYPRSFLSSARLELAALRRSEDSFVDELFLGVVQRGHPLMRAHFPRCYVDVNREPYELDPRMFEGRLPSFANTRSMRVAGGLGTVARVVGDAQEIYGQRIPVDDAIRRIEVLYKPYHRALRRLFTRVHRDFGTAVLIDCHSMPSTARGQVAWPRSLRPSKRSCASKATWSAATSPTRAVSLPSTTVIPPLGCMRFSSRSTARFTW